MGKETDFTIVSAPTSIRFTCPHCKGEVKIDWDDITAPEYWGDPWGYVDCPECREEVCLGEYEYD